MKLICNLIGHRWPERLADVPEGAIFYRIDCERCGESIDAATLRRLCDRLSPGARDYALRTLGKGLR